MAVVVVWISVFFICLIIPQTEACCLLQCKRSFFSFQASHPPAPREVQSLSGPARRSVLLHMASWAGGGSWPWLFLCLWHRLPRRQKKTTTTNHKTKQTNKKTNKPTPNNNPQTLFCRSFLQLASFPTETATPPCA